MATITVINNGDTGLVSRGAINSNFANLNGSKLEDTDVVNDLTTGGITAPLSAQQGVVLKGLIDSFTYTETNDLSASVTWVNVPDVNITQSSVTQHQAALTLTESQISDLDHFTEIDGDLLWVRLDSDFVEYTATIGGAGIISAAPTFTDNGDGTIDISAFSVGLRNANLPNAEGALYDIVATTSLALTDLTENYIYVEYNAGTPQVVVDTSERADDKTNVFLGSAYREGTVSHIDTTHATFLESFVTNTLNRLEEIEGFTHVSGAALSEKGTRNFAISAGVFWRKLNRFNSPAKDTSVADTFTYYYQDGVGGWTAQLAQTQINNTQYDDGSGTLATLGNGRYGVHFVYGETDGGLTVVFGTGDYTKLSDAQDALPPSSLPASTGFHGILVGKIIIQKNDATFTEIQSAFITPFNSSGVTSHLDLADIGTNTHAQIDAALADRWALTGTSTLTGATVIDGGSNALTFQNISALTISSELTIDTGIDINLSSTSALQVAGVDTITFDASQNVTIPNGDLSITGGTARVISRFFEAKTIGAGDVFIQFTPDSGLADGWTIGSDDTGNVFTIEQGIPALNFTSAAAFTIDNADNVTIPNGKLNVTDRIALGLTTGDVATPLEGEIWYNDTDKVYRGSDGTNEVDLGTRISRVTVSSAQLLAINTTPITLIAAPGAGKRIVIVSFSSNYNYGTIAYATDTDLTFTLGSSGFAGSIDISASADSFNVSTGLDFASTSSLDNSALSITTTTSDPTAGDGDVDIHLEYRIIEM